MKQTTTDNTERYAQFGLAALIPGIQHAVDTLQQMLDDARAQLSLYQGLPVVLGQAKVAKVVKAVKAAKKDHRGWPASPEERSREMHRRMRVAAKNAKTKGKPGFTKLGKPLKLHPRDRSHPKHAEWVDMIQKAVKKGQRKKVREAAAKLLPKVVMDKGVAA